jgi:hypothetical protein
VTPPRFIDALRAPLTASVGRLEAMEEFVQFFAQYQDYLAPKLDIYEQAIYLYIVRQTLAEGKREETYRVQVSAKKNGLWCRETRYATIGTHRVRKAAKP